ncbi:PREDICTED: dystonin-like, partial [Pygoscelis adeliae]|uniref:dystonin-like n=1 Tax=Pygoscelis adeliae TaxID=9238 RepID=UPI0004F50891
LLSAEILHHRGLVERLLGISDPLLHSCRQPLQPSVQALREHTEQLFLRSGACAVQLEHAQSLLAQFSEAHEELSPWLEETQVVGVQLSPNAISYEAFKEQQALLQHKLEENLLFSGKFTDALQALMDWLYRAEPQLSEDVPVGGDRDLVSDLMDKHKAEEFHTLVHSFLGRLSESEKTLKYGVFPEEELAVQECQNQLQELMKSLQCQQLELECITSLGEEILSTCHPDSVITIKSWVTVVKSRFQEVNRQVAQCNCAKRFQVEQISANRYRFGESQQLRMVRILRSTLMVRVGGGWIALDEFLVKNDPCRVKGRTNLKINEKYLSPDAFGAATAKCAGNQSAPSSKVLSPPPPPPAPASTAAPQPPAAPWPGRES